MAPVLYSFPMYFRLRKRQRSWLTALVACFMLAASQWALAGYACPQMDAMQGMSQAGKPCHPANDSSAPLCAKHCHPDAQSNDAHSPVFMALLPAALGWTPAAQAHPERLLLARIDPGHCTAPPLAIQFCRFRK
ncbi:MAG: hypothetical protein ACYCZQ_14385 [Burkholderiales bacterium]